LDRCCDELRHGADVFNRLIFVDGVQLSADEAGDFLRVALRSDDQAHKSPALLLVSPKHFAPLDTGQDRPLGVFDHADALDVLDTAEADQAAKYVRAELEGYDERLVYDR